MGGENLQIPDLNTDSYRYASFNFFCFRWCIILF